MSAAQWASGASLGALVRLPELQVWGAFYGLYSKPLSPHTPPTHACAGLPDRGRLAGPHQQTGGILSLLVLPSARRTPEKLDLVKPWDQ